MFSFGSLHTLVAVWMTSLVPASSVTWGSTFSDTATAIATACERRPAFGSSMRCAAVMTALGYHESRFDPRAVGKAGEVGVWQIARSWGIRPSATVETQAERALDLVLESERVCARKPLLERLGWYASGGALCGRPTTSRVRMSLAVRLLGQGQQ